MTTGPNMSASGSDVRLVPLDAQRDAQRSLEWSSVGSGGEATAWAETLSPHDYRSVVRVERERLQTAVDDPNQIVWAIRAKQDIVGIARIALGDTEFVPGPRVDIELSECIANRQLVGATAARFALTHLARLGHTKAYAAHMVGDTEAVQLLTEGGFHPDGNRYEDDSWTPWQNMVVDIDEL